MKCVALCERRSEPAEEEGEELHVALVSVFVCEACAHPSGPLVPMSYLWIDDVGSSFSSSSRRVSSFNHPLSTMHVSFYFASLSLHMWLSPSLSPSVAPQGSLLNAAICLCPPSSPPPPCLLSLPLCLSASLTSSLLMSHSSNYCKLKRETLTLSRKW